MIIRNKNIEDGNTRNAEEIAELIHKYFGKDYKPFVINEKLIKDKIKEKKNHFFIAKENSKIVGVLRTEIEDADLASLRWLCVNKIYRNRGIGTLLTTKALEYLKKIKMRKIILRTAADNKEAIELFKVAGFRQEGYFKNHYRNGIDIIQMAKFLR